LPFRQTAIPKTSVGRAAAIFVDNDRKEVYVADEHLNSSVAKFNARTGAFLKAWGAYGRATSGILEAVL
jgi:hypothetical protein